MITHEGCGRLMQGTWNHDRAHYRCRYPSEYALANHIDHPPSVYLREDHLTEPIDRWLAQAFRPDQIEQAITALETARTDRSAELVAARESIGELDRRLARYREALDAGADPSTIAGWTLQTQADRRLAVSYLQDLEERTDGQDSRPTREEIDEIVEAGEEILAALRGADPEEKNRLYRQLGLTVIYGDRTREIVVEATISRGRPVRVRSTQPLLVADRPVTGSRRSQRKPSSRMRSQRFASQRCPPAATKGGQNSYRERQADAVLCRRTGLKIFRKHERPRGG
ncbi:hypothetical protein ACFWFQ_36290, partial [Nocardia salmonicida]